MTTGTANNSWTWLGLLAVLLLAVPAVLPLAGPGLPVTDDGLFHIANFVDLRQALAGGEVFPRWLEPLAEGLGFPLFNFYPSLSHFLGASLTLFGLSEGDAFKLESGLLSLLAAAAMYVWAHEAIKGEGGSKRTRWFAALTAATTYAYAPYLLVDIYRRGSLAESMALAILPLLFLAVGRLRKEPGLASSLLIAPILAALILAHNVTAVLALGLATFFLAFFCLFDVLTSPQPELNLSSLRRTLLFFTLGMGWGIGLSAFYWMPAILERGYLNFEQLSSGFFSAANHLADGWPPVQASLSFDFEDPFRAGLVQALCLLPGLAPLGTVVSRRFGKAKLRDLDLLSAFFALSVLAVIFLLSPLAGWVWRDVPLLKDMQFPWRTLGLLAFAGSTLTAIGVMWVGTLWPRSSPLFAITLLAGYMAATLVDLPTDFPPVPAVSLGAASNAASLAGWKMHTTQPSSLLSSAAAEALVSIDKMERQPGSIKFEVEASQPTTVALHALYYPGWRVLVDGREIPAVPVSERGLLGVPIPDGRHTVNANFEFTPLQAGAEAVSAFSLLVLVVLLAVLAGRRQSVLASSLAILALASLYVAPRLAAQQVPAQEFRSVAMAPANGIRLLGIGMEEQRGAHQGVTLYWQALRPLDDLESFVALVDGQGNTVGKPTHQPLDGAYPTSRWQVGEIVPDRIELDQLPTLADSGIQLNAGFRPSGQVDIVAPVATFRLPLSSGAPLTTKTPPLARLGDFADLESYASSSRLAAPGDELDVSLIWRALANVPGGVGAYLHLVDGQGRMWAQADAPLGPKEYPAVLWGAGERISEVRRLIVPEEAPPGRYSLRFGGYRYPDLQTLPVRIRGETASDSSVVLEHVFVVAPQTRRVEVAPQQPFKTTFGDWIELVGFDLPEGTLRPGGEVSVTTYWRAIRPVPSEYVLFAHLVDSSGLLRGQHDGQPAAGSYPTSFWQPGEYIVDKRSIRLEAGAPQGDYRLAVGLYSWPAMERLPATREGAAIGSAADLGPLRVLPTSP